VQALLLLLLGGSWVCVQVRTPPGPFQAVEHSPLQCLNLSCQQGSLNHQQLLQAGWYSICCCCCLCCCWIRMFCVSAKNGIDRLKEELDGEAASKCSNG
jgi:hypothetical protein